VDRIIAGDCVDVLAEMPDASVDLIVTDPPYLARYQSRDGRRVTNDDRADWLAPAFLELSRVLKPDRFCVSFYGWHQADRFLRVWRRFGFRPVGHLVWVKDYHHTYEGGFESEDYADLECDDVSPDVVGKKWLVVVDYHR
jgi:DNA modification methylase